MAPATAPDFGLTVSECLEIAPLDQAKVVSGHAGLGRRLRWVHVVDHEDIEDSLTGQELIMTAGVVLGGNEQLQRDIFVVMEKLQIAGLVIALGTYMDRVPDVMLERSEALGIPIIVLPWAINFRDVTHSLLTHLVQSQYVALESAERLNRDLLQIVMRGGGLPALCARLGRLFGRSIGIVDTGAQLLARHQTTEDASDVFRGTGLTTEAAAALAALRPVGGTTQILATSGRRLGFTTPIPTLPQSSGWLIVESDRETVSRFDSLAAEAGAMAAALLLSQATGVARLAERKAEDRVIDILHGAGVTTDAAAELGLRPGLPFIAFAADVEGANGDSALGLIRTFIRRQNLGGQVARRGSMVLGVLQRNKPGITREVFTALVDVLKVAKLHLRIAVSPVLDEVSEVPAGYARAREALRLARFLQPARHVVWAEEMTALTRFLQASDQKTAGDGLFPAILKLQQNDRRQKSALVESLACLADHDWNVSVSARQLGVHRHTLLNRLERMEEILGLELEPILRLELRLQLIAWHLAGSPTG
ncbi:PucR family transcriptional regulator [Acidisoma silvae]|uniref:PucR family transcriptional regulator ligand-binding domain-containing protein n=1 Tax=Acidisoma silvae TaxID=2802396 RepID=A0A963YQP4_9PROT|nr:PucR family transcriptional regulator ligand-binding domain-containing protein [Acidisoma silvae]MCB8874610.1 PucR family transcriptional regulator ligand-binding domain-containing protein [Acidisoma silvae]